ncbi:histone-lysine N-methyltransferase PRDM7-like [Glossophaga mutica]
MNPDGGPQERPEGQAGRSGRDPQAEEALRDASLPFSREEWAAMGDGEKGRYRNVKRNLDVHVSLGLRAPRPAFLCHHRRLQEEDPEDSDEEGAPRQQVKPSWLAFRREQRRHRKASAQSTELHQPWLIIIFIVNNYSNHSNYQVLHSRYVSDFKISV